MSKTHAGSLSFEAPILVSLVTGIWSFRAAMTNCGRIVCKFHVYNWFRDKLYVTAVSTCCYRVIYPLLLECLLYVGLQSSRFLYHAVCVWLPMVHKKKLTPSSRWQLQSTSKYDMAKTKVSHGSFTVRHHSSLLHPFYIFTFVDMSQNFQWKVGVLFSKLPC